MSGPEWAAMLVAIAIGLLARWWVYRKPARSRHKHDAPAQPLVTIAVRSPAMPVTSLTDAYRALPPHCWEVLGR